jgi:hypothetical protein
MHARLRFIALTVLVGGCAATPTPPPVQAPPQPGPAVATRPPAAPATQSPPAAAAAPAKTAAAAKAPVATAPRAAPAPPAPAKAPPAPVAAPLDLRSLEQRLKDTAAIGVLTKLSLKNQVDDLVERFRAFHRGQRPPGLPELRPAFDLLVMKVLSLLQDKDAALAREIDASRNAIWNLLTDREKLENLT